MSTIYGKGFVADQIKPEPPERIYGWLDSQLSLARHYGGLKYQGHDYQIDYAAEGQPLVRVDVIKREANLIKKAKSKAWHEAKVAAKVVTP